MLLFQISVHLYSLLDQTEGEGKAFFGGCKKGTASWDYPQEYLIVIRDKKVSPFVKFEIIPTLLCCLLGSLQNKYRRAWSSKNYGYILGPLKRILLTPRGRFNNYFELPRENVSGNMMLSHWPYLTWKFFNGIVPQKF